MKTIRLTFAFLIIITITSCNNTDFTNPEEVIKHYRASKMEKEDGKRYDEFLSEKSKIFVTKDEFIKNQYHYIPDSIQKSIKHLNKITALPIDINNPSFRRFKVSEQMIFKSDTIKYKYYYSLINENGKWKVIWTNTIQSFATQKWNEGNYSEARKTLEKIIEINPFSGEAYDLLAWCYIRETSLTPHERANGIVNNTKYAIALEEDIPDHYNTLANYYLCYANPDLAIRNYERAIQFCENDKDKTVYYTNLASIYVDNLKFTKAEEYLIKAIKIDDRDAFIWQTYGDLMIKQQKYPKAKEYYLKALSKSHMDKPLQGRLYYSYAFCCSKQNDFNNALEYIIKALDIDPNNFRYLALYNNVKNYN